MPDARRGHDHPAGGGHGSSAPCPQPARVAERVQRRHPPRLTGHPRGSPRAGQRREATLGFLQHHHVEAPAPGPGSAGKRPARPRRRRRPGSAESCGARSARDERAARRRECASGGEHLEMERDLAGSSCCVHVLRLLAPAPGASCDDQDGRTIPSNLSGIFYISFCCDRLTRPRTTFTYLVPPS